ncbi:hypothetical protein [Deinococcus knuensis]|uniref:Integral membrane protein n=1 Tax=Deinococcus knuensis TaxID=1837380 RepID=A0ABQ2SDZ1_9DEIO|nr:hypothetical protein [Deinococcus knuensis]GGS21780.1 hypothetical protein GCM10008961_11530 [Deinococcus knuensis]
MSGQARPPGSGYPDVKRTLIGGTPGSLTLSGHTLHGHTQTGHTSDTQTDPGAVRAASGLWGAAPSPGTLPERLREIDLTLAPERERVIDAEEIAAYLEADGLGDEVLRDRYGTAGLFDAAERLYRQRGTGRALHRPATQSVPAFPWHTLLRGPLYLLPGVSGLLVAREMGAGASAAFVFAAAFGWGWTMLIAGVRYAEPLAVPGRALRLTMLLGGLTGLIGGALVAALNAGMGAALTGAAVGGAVALSTGAAGVLLALRRTGQLAGAFASPLLAAGVVYAEPSRPGALVALLLLALVPLLTALNVTRAPGTLSARWATLRPHLRHAAYGWSLALTFVLLTGRLGAWTLLPLVISTGLLEAGVWHAQERLQHAARRSQSLGALRRSGRPVVLLAAATYALALGAWVYVAANLPIPAWAQAHPDAWMLVPTYGAATLLSAWLGNHGHLPLLTGLWLLLAALLAFALPSSSSVLAVTLLVACAALAALSLRTLLDPRSYR